MIEAFINLNNFDSVIVFFAILKRDARKFFIFVTNLVYDLELCPISVSKICLCLPFVLLLF